MQERSTVADSVSASPIASVPAPAAAVDRVQSTAYDPFAARRTSSRKLVQAVYLLFGVIVVHHPYESFEVVVAFRFVLRALGASPEAGFAQAIYGVTALLVVPFQGLFGASPAGNGSVLEVPSLVALVVYPLVAWGLAKALWLVYGETRSATTTASDSVHTQIR